MLKVTLLALGASLSIAAIAPQDASAQLSGRERTRTDNGRAPTGVYRGNDRVNGNDRVLGSDGRCYDDRNQNARRDRDDDDDRWDREDDDRRNRPHDNGKHKGWYKNGKKDKDCDTNGKKAYCRDNDGRVVRDVRWCRETGRQIYSDGRNDRNDRYDNRSTVGTIGDIILRRPGNNSRDLSYGALQQVLGSGVLQRIDQARNQLGYNGQLTGRWFEASGGSELDLYANGYQIAQILDRNRDGRADVFRWTNAR